MEYNFSPSELDYQPKKCHRCYYISKKFKLSDGGRPPPVFSSLDANKKPYYISINSNYGTRTNFPTNFFSINTFCAFLISCKGKDCETRGLICPSSI